MALGDVVRQRMATRKECRDAADKLALLVLIELERVAAPGLHERVLSMLVTELEFASRPQVAKAEGKP